MLCSPNDAPRANRQLVQVQDPERISEGLISMGARMILNGEEKEVVMVRRLGISLVSRV
jgi:hypothetical protein